MKTYYLNSLRPLTLLFAAAMVAMISQPTEAQMEKRITALYRLAAFVKSAPTLGSVAPELTLKTIDGKSVNLSSYRGKNLVVIKGSYT